MTDPGPTLHRFTDPPHQKVGETWHSICSAHRRFDSFCDNCQIGTWGTTKAEQKNEEE